MKPFVGSGLYLVISYVWLQNLNTPSSGPLHMLSTCVKDFVILLYY